MKCTRCKLINSVNTTVCKRCYTPLLNKSQNSNESRGGIFYDRNLLVVELRASLPKRCYKCNSSNIVENGIQELEYTPFLQSALEFAVGQVIPIPVPLPLTPGKRVIKLDLSFCRQHRGLKPLLVKIGYGTLAFSILCFILGLILKDSPDGFVYLTIASVIIFCVGLLVLYSGTEVETVKLDKYRDSYFWINGFGEDYLKSFPNLIEAQKK
jgi:hypothetical protein